MKDYNSFTFQEVVNGQLEKINQTLTMQTALSLPTTSKATILKMQVKQLENLLTPHLDEENYYKNTVYLQTIKKIQEKKVSFITTIDQLDSFFEDLSDWLQLLICVAYDKDIIVADKVNFRDFKKDPFEKEDMGEE